VTLAVNGYARDPQLVRLVLDAGGDLNTRRADGKPVMGGSSLTAIWRRSPICVRGAQIDAMINGQPMIVDTAYALDWDVVWRLIELGARLDTPQVKAGLIEASKVPGATLPDSPIYPYKVKVWHRPKELGLLRPQRRECSVGPIGKAGRAVMPPRPHIPSMVVAGGVAVQALEPLNSLEENELGHPRRTVGEKPAAGQTGIKVYLQTA
jgi:hypothetical protein